MSIIGQYEISPPLWWMSLTADRGATLLRLLAQNATPADIRQAILHRYGQARGPDAMLAATREGNLRIDFIDDNLES